jgi:hypothetical protein
VEKDEGFMKRKREDMNTVSDSSQVKSSTLSSGERLKAVIADLPLDKVTLAEIRDLLGQDGLMLLTVFLTVVFMIPVSIPGVSTVFGAAILLIGVSRLFNRSLWIPKRFLNRQLPADRLCAGLNRGVIWVHRLEHVSRPHRLKWMACNGFMDAVNNCTLIMAALLLMAPFGLVPFSNTLPALAILFLAIGFLQRDGICILLGHLVNLATVVYFMFLIVGGGAAVYKILHLI